MTYFLRSWDGELPDYSKDDIRIRLLVALGMIEEYRYNVTNNKIDSISLEDYITNTAVRATNAYALFRSITGEKVSKWVPWRNNAKINIDDVMMLSESGLVYIMKKYKNNKVCNCSEVEKIVMAKPGVNKEKIDRCITLIKKELGLNGDL